MSENNEPIFSVLNGKAPDGMPGTIVVSGAGTAAANGTYDYSYDEDTNRHLYIKQGGGAYVQGQFTAGASNGGQWTIASSPESSFMSSWYYSTYGTISLDPRTLTWATSSGANPPPSVS